MFDFVVDYVSVVVLWGVICQWRQVLFIVSHMIYGSFKLPLACHRFCWLQLLPLHPRISYRLRICMQPYAVLNQFLSSDVKSCNAGRSL